MRSVRLLSCLGCTLALAGCVVAPVAPRYHHVPRPVVVVPAEPVVVVPAPRPRDRAPYGRGWRGERDGRWR